MVAGGGTVVEKGPTNGGTDGDDSDIYEQAANEYGARAIAFSKALLDHLHKLTEAAGVASQMLSRIDAPEAAQCVETLRQVIAQSEEPNQVASRRAETLRNPLSRDEFQHALRARSRLEEVAKRALGVLCNTDAPEAKQCAETLRSALEGKWEPKSGL